MLTPEIVPTALRERAQWVCWRTELRDGKETKIPINPTTGQKAKTDDPATWSGFETALEYWRDTDRVEGIGFVFSADDPLVGIDLDDCRDPETGEIDQWAQDIIDSVDTYTEISPSGTGIHLILRGMLPGDRNRRGDIEMYEHLRYFTVTGRPVSGNGSSDGVNECQHELESIYEQHLGGEEAAEPDTEWLSGEYEGPDLEGAPDDDQELIERAKQADNGQKLARLWRGNTAGFDSHSEADMALCSMLAFWTQKDPERMDRLFRRSGLMRPKWDERRGDQTYGELTISKALDYVSDDEVYDPNHYETSSADTDSDLSGDSDTRSLDESEGSRSQPPHRAEQNSSDNVDDRSTSPDAEAAEVTEGEASAELRDHHGSGGASDSNMDPDADSGSKSNSDSDSAEDAAVTKSTTRPTDVADSGSSPPAPRDPHEESDTRSPWYQRELDFHGRVPPYVEKLLRRLRELESEVDRNEDRIQYWRSRAERLERQVTHLEEQLKHSDVDITTLEDEPSSPANGETDEANSEETSSGWFWNLFS
jgi:primase-polymerase (primpol)-like protein